MPYRIEYSPEAEDHLRELTARQREIVFDGVDEHLPYQPSVETRNRKPMRANSIAPWELRLGQIRVYYDIEKDPELIVIILAVGIKIRSLVKIGRKVIEP